MSETVPQFGELIVGQSYTARPGAYGLVLSPTRDVLVVKVGAVFALPGGGRNAGVSLADCLKREYREETGHDVEILKRIGQANQYMFVKQENAYFNKQCHFYTARITGPQGNKQDDDHLPEWLPIEQAAETLTEESHRWAIGRLQKMTNQ